MNLVQQFTNSLWNFSSYKALSKTRGGKSFLYIFLLFTLVFIVFSVSTVFQVNDVLGYIGTAMQEDVPDFRLSDGKFSFYGPMPYRVEEDGFLLVIDTTGATALEDINHVFNGILITENEMIVINSGRVEISPFSALPFELSKDQVINFLPSIKVFVYIFLGIWYLISFAGKLIGVLVLALITMIATAIFNQRLTFGNQWNIAIYASTLPTLVKLVHTLSGSPLSGFFFLIYWSIAITYAFLGVYHISKSHGTLGNGDILEAQAE